MQKFLENLNIDWVLVAAIVPLFLAGLISMKGLGAVDDDYFFTRQLIWIGVGFIFFFAASSIDWRFLRNGWLLFGIYSFGITVLAALLIFARAVRGAQSWIPLGFFSLEPAEPMKLVLILILAKYFSRRHVEIAHVKHIVVSGLYAFVPTLLIFIQPDLGSAIIFSFIWFGMILVSGVSKKHLLVILAIAVISFLVLWFFILEPYQKTRVSSFLNPYLDPKGAGYNALQSMIAVGSGGLWGTGVGYGTQSRLGYLPEHQTDFIFAAFAQEWGFIGVLVLFFLMGLLYWRLLKLSFSGQTNFEKLFGLGLIFFILIHSVVHIGMNIGLLPITGISLPFLSYGGSHTITVLLGLGIQMGMRKYGYASGSTRLDEDMIPQYRYL